LNPQLEDLIKKILIKDPEKRYTIAEIKQHPWITNNGKEPMAVLGSEEIQ
jgi:[calcium/calmodulin-dependent protein kinase] kinase